MSKSVSVDMCAVYVFRLYEDCTLCFFHEQVEPQAFDAEACQQMCFFMCKILFQMVVMHLKLKFG